MDVWINDRLGYVPITKNASTAYTSLFKSLGWQRVQLDQLGTDVELFGHFRDPIDRHFRGTAEFLCQNQITHLVEDTAWQQVWIRSVMDIHGYPVTWAMGNHARKCHWIPINERLDVDLLTQKYLASKGVVIHGIPKLNLSSQSQQRLYHRLIELHTNLDPHNHLSWFYDSDIVLWNSLFPYVDPDNQWHTIY